jgi:D-xylonolactonase
MVTGVGISNGLAFSRDYKTLYHTDSQARSIRAYPYDAASGNIGQGSLWLNLRNAPGEPDGMTMDSDDRIWSARWNGFGIYAYDLSGEEVDFISIPAAKCSSVTFGGDLLDRMFLTSAGGEARRGDADKAGALFMVRGVGRGRAECRSSIASW